MYRVAKSILLAAVVTLVVSVPGSATIIFEDDFPGTSLDMNQWKAPPHWSETATTVADSIATVGGVVSMASYGDGLTTEFTIGTPPTNMYGGFGMWDLSSQYVYLTGELAGHWQFCVNNGAGSFVYDLPSTPAAGDVFSIVRSTDSLALFKNGVLLATDTTVLLTSNTCISMYAYNGGHIGFDKVSVAPNVPEPTCLLLLGAVGLFSRRRGRR